VSGRPSKRSAPPGRARKITIEISADGDPAIRIEIDREVLQRKLLAGGGAGARGAVARALTPDLMQTITETLSRFDSSGATEDYDMVMMHAVNAANAHEEWRRRGRTTCPGCGQDLGTS
jgi:hypothetical protein